MITIAGMRLVCFSGSKRFDQAIWKVQGYALVLFTFLSFLPRLFHFQEYLFFVLLASAVAAAWLDDNSPWIRTPLDRPLLLYAFWILLTVPFSIDPAYSFAEWRKLIAQVLVFYWTMLVLCHQRNQHITMYILGAVVIGTLFLSSYAVIDFFAQGGTWKDRTYRARAPNSDYNWLSTYLVMTIPVIVAAAFVFRTQISRVVASVAIGLAIIAQAFTYSRAAWLGLAVEGIVFGLVTERRRFTMWTLIICLVILTAIVGTSHFGFQKETVSSENFQVRLVIWGKAVQEISHHPIVGLGYGNDTFVKRFGDIPGIGAAGSHSLFFMVAFGSGIPAFLLLIWLLGQVMYTLLRRSRTFLHRDCGVIMIAIAVMIVGISVRNLFDYMFASKLAYLFWVLVATGMSAATAVRTGLFTKDMME